MSLKILIGSLFFFSAFTLNCLPDQFLDLKKNTCRSCSEVQSSVPGGLHNLCKCQNAFWFVLKEGKCLSQGQATQLYQKQTEKSQYNAHSDHRVHIRNLNEVLNIVKPAIQAKRKVSQNRLVNPQPQKEVRRGISSEKKQQSKSEIKVNHETKPVRKTKSNLPFFSSKECIPTQKTSQRGLKRAQTNLRKIK